MRRRIAFSVLTLLIFVTGLSLQGVNPLALALEGGSHVVRIVVEYEDGSHQIFYPGVVETPPVQSSPTPSTTPTIGATLDPTPTEEFPTPSPLPTTTATKLPTVTPSSCMITAAARINIRRLPGQLPILKTTDIGDVFYPDAVTTYGGLLYYQIWWTDGKYAWAADYFTETGACGLPVVNPFPQPQLP